MSGAATSGVEVVRSFLEALEANDCDLAMTYVAADIEYQNMPFPAVRGLRRMSRLWKMLFRIFSRFEMRIRHVAAEGSVVLTERTDAMYVGPVRIPAQVCGTFQVEDGQIVLWRDTFDYASAIVNSVWAGPWHLLRRLGRRS